MNRFESIWAMLCGKMRENRRLVVALTCYLILIVIALVVFLPVRNSKNRLTLGLVLAWFAVLIIKTIRFRDKN
jgi:hypothetical protein